MKAGDLVVLSLSQDRISLGMEPEWEGLPCVVLDTDDPDYPWLKPLRERPDTEYRREACAELGLDRPVDPFRPFYWEASMTHPAYKVVSLRKVCEAAGVDICEDWQKVLDQFDTLDQVAAWVNEDPNGKCPWDYTRRASGPDYVLTQLGAKASREGWLGFARPLWPYFVGHDEIHMYRPADEEYVAKVKAFLEALSDKLGVTEYRRCPTT